MFWSCIISLKKKENTNKRRTLLCRFVFNSGIEVAIPETILYVAILSKWYSCFVIWEPRFSGRRRVETEKDKENSIGLVLGGAVQIQNFTWMVWMRARLYEMTIPSNFVHCGGLEVRALSPSGAQVLLFK